jgi:hypothetical protein
MVTVGNPWSSGLEYFWPPSLPNCDPLGYFFFSGVSDRDIKRIVSRDKYFFKADNIKLILSIHALMSFLQFFASSLMKQSNSVRFLIGK